MAETYIFVPGLIRSPPEALASSTYERDPSERAITPLTYSLVNDMPPVRNQKSQAACVAFTMCAIVEYFAFRSLGSKLDFSEQFVYNCRTNYPDPGMDIWSAARLLGRYGVPYEKLYPYMRTIGDKSSIPPAVFEAALPWRVKSWARVTTIEDLKSAIVANGPCSIGFPMYNTKRYFWRDDGTPLQGGHAVAVVGWDEAGFIIRNSWGAGWNGDGYTRYPYSDWGMHWDLWTLTAGDQPIPPTPPVPPTPVPDKEGCGCGQCSQM